MKEIFEKIHLQIAALNDPAYKGIQLYFSALQQSEVLFIGINPGAGYFNYENKLVKRFAPLERFEYVGQKYYLATQTKEVFQQLGLENLFSKSVKINHFPFATRNEKDLNTLLRKYDKELKLFFISKRFIMETIKQVKPSLIVCEGKSSFDRLKSIINADVLEYNTNTFIMKTNECTIIGYKRHLSYIKDKDELVSKIKQYWSK